MFAQGEISPALNYRPSNSAYECAWDNIIGGAEEFNDPPHFHSLRSFRAASRVNGDNLQCNCQEATGAGWPPKTDIEAECFPV